jgi:hypothetical protein
MATLLIAQALTKAGGGGQARTKAMKKILEYRGAAFCPEVTVLRKKAFQLERQKKYRYWFLIRPEDTYWGTFRSTNAYFLLCLGRPLSDGMQEYSENTLTPLGQRKFEDILKYDKLIFETQDTQYDVKFLRERIWAHTQNMDRYAYLI